MEKIINYIKFRNVCCSQHKLQENSVKSFAEEEIVKLNGGGKNF